MRDLVREIALTEANFKSGFWRNFPWEGDTDQGWARPAPTNKGAAMHISSRSLPVICSRCGDVVKDADWHSHFCPAREELKGTPFRPLMTNLTIGPEILPDKGRLVFDKGRLVQKFVPWTDEEQEPKPKKKARVDPEVRLYIKELIRLHNLKIKEEV